MESIIELSRRLGMKVIAEGIEEVEQVYFLKSIGCDYIQGYVFLNHYQYMNLKNSHIMVIK